MNPIILAKALFVLIAVPLLLYQVRKPTRGIGRWFLRGMNAAHSGLTDWGLGHVQIGKAFTVLDVGCGGGRTIAKLAALAPEGKVHGIDYSAESVEVSRRENANAVAAGRVKIDQASVSHLPFPDGYFDLVTAVETQYYWPDPVGDMREIHRVLKHGGRLHRDPGDLPRRPFRGAERNRDEGAEVGPSHAGTAPRVVLQRRLLRSRNLHGTAARMVLRRGQEGVRRDCSIS